MTAPPARRHIVPIQLHDWQWRCMKSPIADHLAAYAEEESGRDYPVDVPSLGIGMTVPPGYVCSYFFRDMSTAVLIPASMTT